jgi:hypothetical protein
MLSDNHTNTFLTLTLKYIDLTTPSDTPTVYS